MERKIDLALPTGSTRQEIEAWLNDQGMEHSYSNQPHSFSEVRQEADAKEYSALIVSIIRDTDRSLFVTGSIQVYFLLDEKDRLAKRLVKWEGTGP